MRGDSAFVVAVTSVIVILTDNGVMNESENSNSKQVPRPEGVKAREMG